MKPYRIVGDLQKIEKLELDIGDIFIKKSNQFWIVYRVTEKSDEKWAKGLAYFADHSVITYTDAEIIGDIKGYEHLIDAEKFVASWL